VTTPSIPSPCFPQVLPHAIVTALLQTSDAARVSFFELAVALLAPQAESVVLADMASSYAELRERAVNGLGGDEHDMAAARLEERAKQLELELEPRFDEVEQFLLALEKEGLLVFDHDVPRDAMYVAPGQMFDQITASASGTVVAVSPGRWADEYLDALVASPVVVQHQ
jgi:hypothetical protein